MLGGAFKREEDNMKFQEMTIDEFTEVLASSAPVPGGGGASALAGAVGISLGSMVGALTVGKKKYADVDSEIKELMEKGSSLRKELLTMMDTDAEAFAPLAEAYGIPKDDPSREKAMEKALYAACQAPLDIMRCICRAVDIIGEMADKGAVIAISDAGAGAACCKAALEAASLNVFINTESMKDREAAEKFEREAKAMLESCCSRADEIYHVVMEKIKHS